MPTKLLSEFTVVMPAQDEAIQEYHVSSYIDQRHPNSHIHSIDINDDEATVTLMLPTGVKAQIVVTYLRESRCFYNKEACFPSPEAGR